jgi:hypothetical protein
MKCRRKGFIMLILLLCCCDATPGVHLPPYAINVFIPLTQLTSDNGGELVLFLFSASIVYSASARQSCWSSLFVLLICSVLLFALFAQDQSLLLVLINGVNGTPMNLATLQRLVQHTSLTI